MISLHKLTAGTGYTYYVSETACADVEMKVNQELGDYYTAKGLPPGEWMGHSKELFGISGQVTKEQMANLFGRGVHPDASLIPAKKRSKYEENLGRAFDSKGPGKSEFTRRVEKMATEHKRRHLNEIVAGKMTQIRARVGSEMFTEQYHRRPSKEELTTYIRRKENPVSQVVAGYDLTFAPPKSVSLLWALYGEEARKGVEEAQYEAVQETIAYFEENVARTRTGKAGVAQRKVVEGVGVNRFRHFENRHGEPHLHDHIVISNKVKALVPVGNDGEFEERWFALDGRHVHRQMVELSELYNRKIMEKVCDKLGLETTQRSVGRGNYVTEIAGIDDHLIDITSTRRKDIKAKERELVGEYRQAHGRSPGPVQRYKLFQQATLETRPKKEEAKSLQERIKGWAKVYTQPSRHRLGHLQSVGKQLAEETDRTAYNLQQVADAVLEDLQNRRAVWGKTHIHSTADRYLGTHIKRNTMPKNAVEDVVQKVIEAHSIQLTSTAAASKAYQLNHDDGVSLFHVHGSELYTSKSILHAEHELLTAAQTDVLPAAEQRHFDAALLDLTEKMAAQTNGQMSSLDSGQQRLAQAFATSEKQLLIGVGPAGSGKTTAMQVAVKAVQNAGGHIVALAPRATAAQVLSKDLSKFGNHVQGETIDRYLVDITNGRAKLHAGDMVIIDEAGMSGTPIFNKIVQYAAGRGALVRAIGDHLQLGAVGAGGALRLINSEVGSVELEELHRFHQPEEALASLELRDPARAPGREAFEWYRDNGRVMGGDREHIIEAAHKAWAADLKRFAEHPELRRTTILTAPDNDTVAALNERAQATIHGEKGETVKDVLARITKGGVKLSDGLTAVRGDTVLTRRNNRQLAMHQGKDYAKNGDRWTVTATHRDGSLDVVHQEHGAKITLPTHYVRHEVQLGYAATSSAAQGLTVTTSHNVGTENMPRSAAYVPLTRGRESNHLYMVLGEDTSLDEALDGIAARVDDSLSAHELIERAITEQHNISALRNEYVFVDEAAQDARISLLFTKAIGHDAAMFTHSPAFGAIAANVRKAEEQGVDAIGLINQSFHERDFEKSIEDGAIMAWRIEKNTQKAVELLNQPRPLATIPDERLNLMLAKAKSRVRSTTQAAGSTTELPATYPPAGVKSWHERMYGRFSHGRLEQDLSKAQNELLRIIPSKDPDEAAARKLRWKIRTIENEQRIRAGLDMHAAETENAHRGVLSNWSKAPLEENNADKQRMYQASTILSRLETEHKIRTLAADPTTNEHLVAQVLRDSVPEWIAPTHALAYGVTTGSLPEAFSAELMARRSRLEKELLWRGHELAAQPPAWADKLGPVPSDPLRQAEWKHLAAQIDTFRQTYKIPHTETEPIPDDYLKTVPGKIMTADELATQIKAIHKYTAMTKKPPVTIDELEAAAELARAERDQLTMASPAAELAQKYRDERNRLAELRDVDRPEAPGRDEEPRAGRSRPTPPAGETGGDLHTQEEPQTSAVAVMDAEVSTDTAAEPVHQTAPTALVQENIVQDPDQLALRDETLQHLRTMEERRREVAEERRAAEQRAAAEQRRRDKDAQQLHDRRAKAQKIADAQKAAETPAAAKVKQNPAANPDESTVDATMLLAPVEINVEHQPQPNDATEPQPAPVASTTQPATTAAEEHSIGHEPLSEEQLAQYPDPNQQDQEPSDHDLRFYQEAEFLQQQQEPTPEIDGRSNQEAPKPGERKSLAERIAKQNAWLKQSKPGQRSPAQPADSSNDYLAQAFDDLRKQAEQMKQDIEELTNQQKQEPEPQHHPEPGGPEIRGPQR